MTVQFAPAPVLTSAFELGPRLLHEAFHRTLSPMVITDTTGRICHVNPAFEQATGYELAELYGKQPTVMHSRMQSSDFYRRMWTALLQEGRWQGEIWNRRKDGRLFREWLSISALQQADGEVTHYLGVYSGLASTRMADAQSEDYGGVDAVTGILGRHAFIKAAERLHAVAGPLAFMALDITGFTDINEHHGLYCGDGLLRQVAHRCTQAAALAGVECVVGRVGSDEFALAWAIGGLDGEDRPREQVHQMADQMRQAVATRYQLDSGRSVDLRVSVGLAVLTADALVAANQTGFEPGVADALLQASAARQAQGAPACSMQHYDGLEAERRLTRALREDIMAGRLDVVFQPKVRLSTSSPVGLEALCRWTGPDGQAVPPSVFIPLAERHGLIAELGDRVLETVLRSLARWHEGHLSLLPVAVNFSAAQFKRPDVVARVEAALARHRVPPELIELELTESVLLEDFEAAVTTLQGLRRLGLSLSIDDFGTGYSSLAYMRRLPVNCIKIDRSFVADLVSDDRTRHVVATVISLAHRFGMECVAEGVETFEQVQVLMELGCEQAQGYFFARPLAPEALAPILAGRTPWIEVVVAPGLSASGQEH